MISDASRRGYGFERWIIEEPSRQDDEAALRGFVAERDVGCPSCDYNLRGLTGDVCPECGVGLRLRVGLAEPRVLGLIVAVGGASSLAGIGAFFIIGWLLSGEVGDLLDEPLLMGVLFSMVALGGGGLWLLVKKRRRVFAMEPAGQRWLAFVSVAVTVFAIAIFFRVLFSH
ncbi:MAG: hypothetical protein AAF710_08815 [Planctomycetota bacterium]